jgi:uridine kinase
MPNENRPVLIGIAGGSGSGKTYFAEALLRELGEESCEVVYQDNFYFDQSSRFDHDGGAVNFDHPDSIDFDSFAECLRQLKEGRATEIPTYDFATHSRRPQCQRVEARPVILIDGILIFHSPAVRDLLDDLVFVDTPEKLRFERRLDRDVRERGRTPDGVREQFVKQVKPMHDRYVEPSKAFAKTVVCDEDAFTVTLQSMIEALRN